MRNKAFAAILVMCVLAGGAFVVMAVARDDSTESDASASGTAADVPADTRLLVRAVDPKDPRLNGPVETVAPASGTVEHAGRELACQRVHFAAGRGMCLALAPSGVDYEAHLFDESYRVTRTVPLAGLPSRTRVSRDGRYASTTTFVTGDSYTSPGEFSTRTNVIDLANGRRVADLEDFQVIKDGKRIDAVDFNFWGVTFTEDSNRFYATLGTGDEHYLIEGDLAGRSARVIGEAVECPSLSPDERRIGFKQPLGGGKWRFSVMELDSGKRWQLSETRSIDDQLEWLDDERLLYGDGKAVWMVRADGKGKPDRIASRADSPTVLR